jgi:redox-sensing transcriptional repressor
MAESRSEPPRQPSAPRSKRRPKRKIPDATVARLPLYLRSLVDIADGGATTVSSERLAELSGVNAAKVRKDLSYLGSYGTRGVGYDVEFLLFQMSRELGLTSDWPVVIVGLGNLGHALANYGGFGDRGFPVAALVDVDERVVGTTINGITVRHLDDLPEIARDGNIAIGIIATPAHAAQQVADRLAAAGVTSVLNFAPTVLSVPEEVSIRKVDLAVELQILSFYQRRKLGDVADVVSSEMAGAITGDGHTLRSPSTDETEGTDEDQSAPRSAEPAGGDGTFGDGDRAGMHRTPD